MFATLKKYPLLSRLLIYQVIALMMGVSVGLFGYHLISKAKISASLEHLKKELNLVLISKQEQWRTWKFFGLENVLEEDVGKIKEKFSLKRLQVVSKSDAVGISQFSNVMILPENFQKDDSLGLVVLAELDADQILSQYRANNFTLYFCVLVSLLFLAVVFSSWKYVYNRIYLPIFGLNRAFSNMQKNGKLVVDEIKAFGEIKELLQFIGQMYNKSKNYEKVAAIGQVASQVAHDIRSPLVALKTVCASLPELPEEKRIMIRHAVQRIDDIANDLSSKKNHQGRDEMEKYNLSVCLLSSLIEPLVSEQRFRHRAQMEIDLQVFLDHTNYGLFAKLEQAEFKRVLSNLINNSVEAINEKGFVSVEMSADKNEVRILVKDTGKGIAEEILPKLMLRGFTYGKENGQGLGLYHASESVKKWGGTLTVDSKKGEGTIVAITLPRAQAPDWFVPEIDLLEGDQIVSPP